MMMNKTLSISKQWAILKVIEKDLAILESMNPTARWEIYRGMGKINAIFYSN